MKPFTLLSLTGTILILATSAYLIYQGAILASLILVGMLILSLVAIHDTLEFSEMERKLRKYEDNDDL